MKKNIVLYVGYFSFILLISACSVKHTEVDYRKKFNKNNTQFTLDESSSSVTKRLYALTVKCFDDTVTKETDSGFSQVDGSSKVKMKKNEDGSVTIVVPHFMESKTMGAKMANWESFWMIMDIKSLGKSKTEVKFFYRTKYVGEALRSWIKKEGESCPDLQYYL